MSNKRNKRHKRTISKDDVEQSDTRLSDAVLICLAVMLLSTIAYNAFIERFRIKEAAMCATVVMIVINIVCLVYLVRVLFDTTNLREILREIFKK